MKKFNVLAPLIAFLSAGLVSANPFEAMPEMMESVALLLNSFFGITNPDAQVGLIRFLLFILFFAIFFQAGSLVFRDNRRTAGVFAFVIAFIGMLGMPDSWIRASGGMISIILGQGLIIGLMFYLLYLAFFKLNEGIGKNLLGFLVILLVFYFWGLWTDNVTEAPLNQVRLLEAIYNTMWWVIGLSIIGKIGQTVWSVGSGGGSSDGSGRGLGDRLRGAGESIKNLKDGVRDFKQSIKDSKRVKNKPSPVRRFKVEKKGDKMHLSWAENSPDDNVKYYELQRKTGYRWKTINNFDKAKTSADPYEDNAEADKVSYRIRAVSQSGDKGPWEGPVIKSGFSGYYVKIDSTDKSHEGIKIVFTVTRDD